MRVLGYLLGRVTRTIHNNLLCDNEIMHCLTEVIQIKHTLIIHKPHQVQRSQVTSTVIQKQVLRTRVTRHDLTTVLAGMPLLNSTVILQTRVATFPSTFSHTVEQFLCAQFLKHTSVRDRLSVPGLICDRSLHKLIRHPHRQVLVLVHSGTISLTIERRVISLID